MANFGGDFSSQYISSAALFATSTGVTTDANAAGVSVDMAGDVANVMTGFLIVGNVAGTGSPTLSMKFRESTSGTGDWTDVTDGAFTAVSTSNQLQALPIKPTKRYVSVTGTVAGTNPVFEATVMVLAPRRSPANYGGFSQTVAAGDA